MTTTRTERLMGARSVFAARVMAREVQRVEDVDHLRKAGFSAGDVAVQAGFPSVSAAGRYFYRKGLPGTARWFEAERRKMEKS